MLLMLRDLADLSSFAFMYLIRDGFELSFFFSEVCSVELQQLESSDVDMVSVYDFIQTF